MEKVVIKWTINKYREDKRTGVLNPVEPSDYFKFLAGEGDQREGKRD
nr:hypothetical protein [uncultured Allobacillus sp.]